MDKDNESYLDGLLETFGQEPPYETDRRRKATARAKSGKKKTSSADITVDSLEEEFSLDDLDDSFLDDIDLDDLADPLEDKEYESEVSTGDIPDGNENEDIIPEDSDTVVISESPEDSDGSEEAETEEELPVDDAESQDDIRPEKPGEDVQTVADAEESSVTGEDETSPEENSVEEAEQGDEISGDFGSDVGTEPEAEPGEELGVELGSEIGEEIGFDEEDEAGEISFDDTEPVEEDNSLPEINPLDEMGEPEVLSDKEIESNKSAKKENSEKKGLFSKIFNKLFANVPLTEEELAAIPTPEQEEEAKKEKEAEAAKKKEDKKAAAEADKKKKAEAAKKKAADNKAKKSAKKAAKKEAELKRLRAEALEQPEGKINKAGAIIIFLFFIVAAAVVIVGTNIFSYDISIADATYKFGNHKYTEAYEGIRGLKIKEKDMEIHDKIYTVMFVNKQLNSYNNFFAMGDYASALDSLIKGLSRYDKYIALARQLGIHTDLDYVRKQIMAELQSVYGVPEREALELMDMTDKQDYSERIYSIVSKLDTKAIEAGKERRELVP